MNKKFWLLFLHEQKSTSNNKASVVFRMFWNVQIWLIQGKTLISIIQWVLNAILFSAAFRHIPFGCESCESSGQTKVQQPLNRSEAELDEVNRSEAELDEVNRSEAELDEVNMPER